MRVLVLAPQPFYQERGTPIAVRLALEALSRRLRLSADSPPAIDALVYNEGIDVSIPGVRIVRTRTPASLCGIRPGISCKKLLCDLFFLVDALRLLWRARGNQYHVIHAVEESVFIAWLAKLFFRVPYIYDMDSSLALQLVEKWWWCKPLLYILQYIEGLAVRGSIAVAPVCDALEIIAHQHGSHHTVLLRDVSLLPVSSPTPENATHQFGEEVSRELPIILYVGNLESYQGIDLLLDSFAKVYQHASQPQLVIVGGNPSTITAYSAKARRLGCSDRVFFVGPRPVGQLRELLQAADILVSPRIKGNNTPMKIYSYLHSGTCLLATDLPTHRQVLDEDIALLAAPDSMSFSQALRKLLEDPSLRDRLGRNAQARAEKLYTVEAFEKQLGALYETVAHRIGETLFSAPRAMEGS